MLALSSGVTSLTVLLIIIFLFKEGLGIFGTSSVEKGNALVVNASNPVKELSPKQVKAIFNQEITAWDSVGGKKEDIVLFTINDIGNFYTDEELGENFEHLGEKVNELVVNTPNIIAYVPDNYITKAFAGRLIKVEKVSPRNFLFNTDWFPTSTPAAQFGVMSLILGTIWVSFGAILIALPFGLAAAIYMAEIADPKLHKILKPLIELLAGIPSVVYGFFGLVVVVPLIQSVFKLPVGETALAGSIVLGIMALPTIITISEDALRTTPRAMKEASLALGATRWQTIVRVMIPFSISGISAAIILGIGRAMGETMAVLMVTGNSAQVPHSYLQPVRTIPATIAAELGETQQGGPHYKALFALGCILFIITFIINLIVEFTSRSRNRS